MHASDVFQIDIHQIVVTHIKSADGEGMGLPRNIKHENHETEVTKVDA